MSANSITENSANRALALNPVNPVNPSPVSTFWLDVVDGVTSAARRTFQIFQSSFGGGYVVPGMGAGVGVMDFASGAIGLRNAAVRLRTAIEIGDGEGERRAAAHILQNSYVILGGISFATQQIAQLAHAVALAASMALGWFVCAAYGGASLVGIGVGTLGIYRNMTFRTHLKTNTNRDEEIMESLKWLKEKITVTAAEKKAICEDPSLESDEEKQAEIDKVQQRKIEHMARRTSPSIMKELVEFDNGWGCEPGIDRFIRNVEREFEENKADPEAAHNNHRLKKRAVKLINEVKQANLENTLKKVVGVVAATLFLIGIIMATLASAGSVPLILLGVSSIINTMILFKN
ncbi:MAG TPA: hypothetical protein VLE95_03665 [Chlamydiales bacterium]|nr:hypothetical protein [Chlamydiales bacterium]